MSEEQKTAITLKSTATALSNVASKAASHDLRPAGRLLEKLIRLVVGLGISLISVGWCVGLVVQTHADELRSKYVSEVIFGDPLPADVADEILTTFRLIKTGPFDVGKYMLIDSLNEEKGLKLLGQVSKYCVSSGRNYAAQNVKYSFQIVFETNAFKRLARTGTRECEDEVVRGILSRSPDK